MSEIQGKPVYGICECKERVQVLSVDQATDLVQQMAANGFQVPTDYIPKTSVNGVIEQHNKDEIKFWRGTKAEYDALTDEEKAIYTPIYTDDPRYQEAERRLDNHDQSIENINARLTKLGFKEGSITFDTSFLDANATQKTDYFNKVRRQGNYVIGDITVYGSIIAKISEITGTFENFYSLIGQMPENFYPVKEIGVKVCLGDVPVTLYIEPDGDIYMYKSSSGAVSISGKLDCNFGFEAAPID